MKMTKMKTTNDDGIDEMDELDADEQEVMIADTAAVRQTVSKVLIDFINL